MKYVCIKISGVITQIATMRQATSGMFSTGVLESFLPDEDKGMSNKKYNAWIKENNIRMNAICKFLNDNNL